MKLVKFSILFCLVTALFTANVNALPPVNGTMVINEQYGHECFDPNAVMPSNEAMTSIMASMNCNSITDPAKFCECVKVVAEPLNIENPTEKFKEAFIHDKLFSHKRNLNVGLGLKFRDSFLSALKNTEGIRGFDACSITNDRPDLEEHPVAARIHERMQRNLVQVKAMMKRGEFQGNKKQDLEQLTAHMSPEEAEKFKKDRMVIREEIRDNVSSIAKSQYINKSNNRKAAARIIKYMATHASTSGKSYANEFLKERKDQGPAITEAGGPLALLQQKTTDEKEDTKTLEYRAQLFKKIMTELKDDPIIKRSSLGVSDDQELMSDVYGIFNKVVTGGLRTLQHYDKINFEELLKESEIDEAKIDERTEDSFKYNLANAFGEACFNVVGKYDDFLKAFKQNGHSSNAFSYVNAEQEYYDLFSASRHNQYGKEEAERAYRILEAKLTQDYGRMMTKEPSQLMLILDLHYCTTPPTSPNNQDARFAAKFGAVHEAQKVFTVEAASAARSPASEIRNEDLKERISDAHNKSMLLNATYMRAVDHYNASSLKKAKIELELQRQRNALMTLEKDPDADTLMKNMAINKIAELEQELIQAKAVEEAASIATNDAYQLYKQHDRESYEQFGPSYRLLINGQLGFLADQQEDCFKRFIPSENGFIPNPNWHEEAAKCQAEIRDQIKEELEIDISDTSNEVHTPYYSTNAGDNLDLSINRTHRGNARSEVIVNTSVSELEKYGKDLGDRINEGLTAQTSETILKDKEISSQQPPSPEGLKEKGEILDTPLDEVADKEADPFATDDEINQIKGQENLGNELKKADKLDEEGLIAGDAAEDGEATAKKMDAQNGSEMLEDEESAIDKFDEIAKTLGNIPGTTVAENSEKGIETKRIQEEARAIIDREEEIAKTKELAESALGDQDKKDPNQDAELSPAYQKLLKEVQTLRGQNDDLRNNVNSMAEARKAKEKSKQQDKTPTEEVVDNAVAAQTSNEKTNNEVYNFSDNSRQPASVADAAKSAKPKVKGKKGAAAPQKINRNTGKQTGSTTVLPTPITRGGELQNATVALNSTIALEAKALPILSGIDQSREVLTGDAGLNGYLNLVGTNNELTMDSFNDIRLNPDKFSEFNIDSSQPIIIKTPEGHMVMLAVVEKNEVTGFRYVKEIKPSHVARRIASEEAELNERKARFVYDSNLDALLDSNTKK